MQRRGRAERTSLPRTNLCRHCTKNDRAAKRSRRRDQRRRRRVEEGGDPRQRRRRSGTGQPGRRRWVARVSAHVILIVDTPPPPPPSTTKRTHTHEGAHELQLHSLYERIGALCATCAHQGRINPGREFAVKYPL